MISIARWISSGLGGPNPPRSASPSAPWRARRRWCPAAGRTGWRSSPSCCLLCTWPCGVRKKTKMKPEGREQGWQMVHSFIHSETSSWKLQQRKRKNFFVVPRWASPSAPWRTESRWSLASGGKDSRCLSLDPACTSAEAGEVKTQKIWIRDHLGRFSGQSMNIIRSESRMEEIEAGWTSQQLKWRASCTAVCSFSVSFTLFLYLDPVKLRFSFRTLFGFSWDSLRSVR